MVGGQTEIDAACLIPKELSNSKCKYAKTEKLRY
jgi:hypothetical protein